MVGKNLFDPLKDYLYKLCNCISQNWGLYLCFQSTLLDITIKNSHKDEKRKETHEKLTKPTKKRTATAPERTAGYCIHVLLTAILRLKLFAVEKTPMKRSTGRWLERGEDFSASKSIVCSESSDVGKPLAKTEISFRSPEILTSLTSHGSKVWIYDQQSEQISSLKVFN